MPPYTREAHDRAFFRTLIVLIAIIVIGMIVDRAWGQDEPVAASPKTPQVERRKVPRKVEPEVNSKIPEAPAAGTRAATIAGYQTTTEQAKDLRIVQLEAINAQQAWNTASQRIPEYQTYQQAVNNIYAVCARIKSENKLPADIGCDINKNPITFEKIPIPIPIQVQASAPTAPATPSPATVPAKKAEPKKP